MNLIDEAFEYVQSNEPSPTTYLVARLGCELERLQGEYRQLNDQNRHIRRSYKRLKQWFTRQFKYYKAHRDELVRQKQEMESPLLRERKQTRNKDRLHDVRTGRHMVGK